MKVLLTTLTLCLMPMMAFAQTTTASTQVGTAAQSGSYSGVNNNFSSSPNPSDTTLRTAPAISAPTLYTMSTCATPISGGVSVVGVGVSAGTVYSSKSCEQEQEDAIYVPLLGKLGQNDVAMALLCENKDVANAVSAVGKACPQVPVRATPAAFQQTTTTTTTGPGPAPAPAPTPNPAVLEPPKHCEQVFVPPSNPDGAGYLQSVCN